MYKKETVVNIEKGLHARPASQLVQLASKFNSEITLEFNDKTINIKSIFHLMTAGIKYENKVIVTAEGEDEQQAVEEVTKFIETHKE